MMKIFIFGICVIASVMYFIKDKDIQTLNSPDVYQSKDSSKNGNSEKNDDPNKPKPLNKFSAGECLTLHKDGWEYTKILKASEQQYEVIDCHIYKSCSKNSTTIDRFSLEVELKDARKITCPKRKN